MANPAGPLTPGETKGVPSYVPSEYVQLVQHAADATGLPASVVAAQIDLESSFNPQAVSPAGAEGIAQFEPGTFSSYGPKGGSPFNVSDAFQAYTAYMSELLKQEGGSVRKALEAYNAGPGNLPAGAGYATTILDKAAVNQAITAIGQGVAAGGTAGKSSAGGINIPGLSTITDFFSGATTDLADFLSVFKAFFQPSTYIRLGAGAFGFVFLILTLFLLYKETKNGSN